MDGRKIHADASKSKAISGGHLAKREGELRQEVVDLMAALAKAFEEGQAPEGFDHNHELRLEKKLSGMNLRWATFVRSIYTTNRQQDVRKIVREIVYVCD